MAQDTGSIHCYRCAVLRNRTAELLRITQMDDTRRRPAALYVAPAHSSSSLLALDGVALSRHSFTEVSIVAMQLWTYASVR
jgi:hypothetical protein